MKSVSKLCKIISFMSSQIYNISLRYVHLFIKNQPLPFINKVGVDCIVL